MEWVNVVSSWVLKEELKEVMVSVEGEWNDTADRLAQQLRQNCLQFQSELG
jgi:hypothetical protein